MLKPEGHISGREGKVYEEGKGGIGKGKVSGR